MTNNSKQSTKELSSRKEKLFNNLKYLLNRIPDDVSNNIVLAIYDTIEEFMIKDDTMKLIKENPHRLLIIEDDEYEDSMDKIYSSDEYRNISAYYLNDGDSLSKIVSFYSYLIADVIRQDKDPEVIQPTYRLLSIIRYMLDIYIKNRDIESISSLHKTLNDLTNNMKYIDISISIIDDLCHGDYVKEEYIVSRLRIKQDMEYINSLFFLAFEM